MGRVSCHKISCNAHSEMRLALLCRGILTEALLDIPYPLATEHGLEDLAGATLLSSVCVQKTQSTAAAHLRLVRFHIRDALCAASERSG
jgi:hypothetical protein